MENKIKRKKKNKNKSVFNYLDVLELRKLRTLPIEASIYRLSNVGPYFINCVVDPQNSGPNRSLCPDIESSVAIESLVFCRCLCCSFLFSVTTYSLGLLLDCVATYFDNVAT